MGTRKKVLLKKASQLNFFNMIIHLFVVLFCISSAFSAEADIKTSPSSRNGRLFYVYTDKTTSLCYVTGATPTACSGRKKRGVWMDNMDLDVDVAASPVEEEDDINEDQQELVESALSDPDSRSFREEKVLLYWLTTTSVSTKFSYTRTFTIGSIRCTPSEWPNTICGK